MSQLAQLKQTVHQIAEGSKKVAGSLGQFDQQFSQQINTVQQAIGGSAQGKDKEVVAATQEASKAVKSATAALQNAARIAQQYSQSL